MIDPEVFDDGMHDTKKASANTHAGALVAVNAYGQGRWLPSILKNTAASVLVGAAFPSRYWSGPGGTSAALSVQYVKKENFAAVETLTAHFGQLDVEDPLYLEPDAVDSGVELLRRLNALSVPAPQAFAHGADALVLKWKFGGAVDYVTICDNHATLLRQGAETPETSVDLDNEKDFIRLAMRLGGRVWIRPETL